MPHNVPEEKEWLHLRDAICLGDVDAIVDQLLMEGIAVEYGEMEAELISMKTNLGWDSCAVVDKETFKESINKLISESIAIPQPQDAPEFKTYKELFNRFQPKISTNMKKVEMCHRISTT